jgi:serine/threonine-protein kinase RsbW
VDEAAGPQATSYEATLRLQIGPLLGPVLSRVVAMIAARVDCPVDRLDDALLVADAVAAHSPEHARNGHVSIRLRADREHLELVVGSLADDGASRLLAAASLPGVGNVLERFGEAQVTRSDNDEADVLAIRLSLVRPT